MKFLFLLFLSLSSFASDFPDFPFFHIDSDSGIKGPPYQKIVEELQDLEQTYPNFSEVIHYGQSLDGHPLTVIKIHKKDVPSTRAIYIGGSIHGDEYLNIEDRLPRWFLEQTAGSNSVTTYLNSGGVVYIVPILNPDGYDRRRRTNRNGVDLNRDYTVLRANVLGFKEVETKMLFEFLNSELAGIKLDLAMDYHCCIGALLYPWSFSGPDLPSTHKEKHIDIVNIMQANLGTVIRGGTTPVILGYSAKGTSKDFYYEHFGALGFTFEGRRNQENGYFEEHTQMWDGILLKLINP